MAVQDFDELGVPAAGDKVWRQRTTEAWLARALDNDGTGAATQGTLNWAAWQRVHVVDPKMATGRDHQQWC